MYEELVKRLRDISNSESKIKSNYIGLTMIQAADAIEELSAENKKLYETIKRAYLIINSLMPNMEETE